MSRVTPSELAQWRNWYDRGQSTRQIGARAGRDHKVVLHALRNAGVELRSVGAQPAWREGWCDECCDTHPLSPYTGWCAVCTILNQPKTMVRLERISA